ncbi:MAG: TolC family protein [Candidatus Aminicenantes bacterium]|nr:TolC family protein [Candidatus Aminicenantes bacterium]
MNKKILLVIFLLILFLTLVWSDTNNERTLSLEECIITTLENNLDVAVQVLNTEISDETVISAGEIFFPQLQLYYNQESTNSASFSWIESEGTYTEDTSTYQAVLSQLLPIGGRLQVTLLNYRNENNDRFQTINPLFYSNLRFTLTQPLLRDFGLRTTRREIIAAKYSRDISEENLKTFLMTTIYNVETAYWNLVYSMENLKAQQWSLDLARDLLEMNLKEVEVGMMAPIEISIAEAEVATREADILQAEADIHDNTDVLLTLLNLPQKEGEIRLRIIPKDKPSYEKVTISAEEALETAYVYRPDLNSLKTDVKSRKLDVSYARNQLLPNLNLEARYWSPGVSGTQILFRDGNPLTGEIVGTLPGGRADAFKDAFNFLYQNWSVAFTLDIPLNSIFSHAEYSRARLSLKQAELQVRSQEKTILQEIKSAVRAVDTEYKKVIAYKKARELAEINYRNEEKRWKVGLTTNYQVLLLQRDLAAARSAEIRAVIDYNLALAALNQAMGISLKQKNIVPAIYH